MTSHINSRIISSFYAVDTPESADRISVLKNDLLALDGALVLDAQVEELKAKKKDLIARKVRENHWFSGSILLGAGTVFTIVGKSTTEDSL